MWLSQRKRNNQHDMLCGQLQEKSQEHNVELYTTLVDLTKAFDTVSHEGQSVAVLRNVSTWCVSSMMAY
jgi:hypothetical protein